MALSLIAGECALAQGNSNNDRNNRDNQKQVQRNDQQDGRDNYARQPKRGQNPASRNNNARNDQRGAGPDHSYYTGQRMPSQFRSRQYVVDDWHGHGLSAPPRGYHWVQSGSDYVLVAIATGVILQLLLNN
jgi:Ni/Co efflux regulator RcnB